MPRPDEGAPRDRIHSRHAAARRPARREGLRLSGREGRRRLQRARVRHLRQAFRPIGRRSARRRARLRFRCEARSARLRALEEREAGRAAVGFEVGSRTSGLAHRMLGDVDEASRRNDRHSRRRPGPHLPASRERNRSERGGDGQALRQLLDARGSAARRARRRR